MAVRLEDLGALIAQILANLSDEQSNALSLTLRNDPALMEWFALKSELDGFVVGEGNLPAGGTTGQVPRKKSDEPFDIEWGDPPDLAIGTHEASEGVHAIAAVSGLQSALDAIDETLGDLATVATSGAYSDLSGTPTLGTAAAQDTSAFATAAQGGLADTALQSGNETVVGVEYYASVEDLPTSGVAGVIYVVPVVE